MRRRLIIGLMVLNGLIAAVLFATPAISQIIPRGLFNCCKNEATEKIESAGAYCCHSCCWFYMNCRIDEDCERDPQT